MSLKDIFLELAKENISVLTLEVKAFISNESMRLYNLIDFTDKDIEDLKYLIMIGNLLYNRTDRLVLPIEDGVYDILLEKYKTFDKNFQVGSEVVNFKSQQKKELLKEGKQIITPFHFIEEPPNDEMRDYFRSQIKRFDKNSLNARDLFYNNPFQFINEDYISKRTHNTKHNHPQLVGTLDKSKFVLDSQAIEMDCYDDSRVKILERDFFRKHIDAGIISENEEIEIVIELKYDGISVEADCDTIVESARTRGNTGVGEAADITPILYGYKFPNNTVLKDRLVGVKFEAIMTKSNLKLFNEERGYHYANCRTAIIGLFGASDANKYIKYITLIPLALDRDNVPEVRNRMEEIELLNSLYKTKGEPLRYCYISGNYKTCLYLINKFAQEAMYARNYLDFMFDGIVVSYLDENIREKLGRENFINKYSMAVKFEADSKLTTFLGYTFEVGQTGNICPMIHYSPVEFFGTIHPKSSGASLKRFKDLSLKVGDVIEVTYTNDVMPYVTAVDCEANRQNNNPLCEFPTVCPICGTPLVISSSGNSASCPNINCDGRKVARMTNMLQKLNIKGFAESTIIQLGKFTLKELFESKEDEISNIIGPTNAYNFTKAMENLKSNPIEDYRIIGSLGFTNISTSKWKLIFAEISLKDFIKIYRDDSNYKSIYHNLINNIKGLGTSASETIINELPYYINDMEYICYNCNVIDTKSSKVLGKSIRFTGCRDKQLEDYLRSLGYDADGSASVTKSTDILLVPYKGFSSTKTSKVSPDCLVIDIASFKEAPDKYL